MRFGLWHLDSHANSHHCRIDNGPLQTASQGVANVRKCCDTELTTRLGDGGPDRLAYRLEEAAALLSVSRSTLYRMIDRGELLVIHIGTAPRIPHTSLEQFVNAKVRAARIGQHQ